MQYYNSRDLKRLRELQLIAIDLTPTSGSRVAAGVIWKGDWIGFGTNSMKTHPLQKRFNPYPYLHAEIDALIHAQYRLRYEKERYQECSIYIARAKIIEGEWNYGLAKPCESCEHALREFKIKKIIWSSEGGADECGRGSIEEV